MNQWRGAVWRGGGCVCNARVRSRRLTARRAVLRPQYASCLREREPFELIMQAEPKLAPRNGSEGRGFASRRESSRGRRKSSKAAVAVCTRRLRPSETRPCGPDETNARYSEAWLCLLLARERERVAWTAAPRAWFASGCSATSKRGLPATLRAPDAWPPGEATPWQHAGARDLHCAARAAVAARSGRRQGSAVRVDGGEQPALRQDPHCQPRRDRGPRGPDCPPHG